MIRSVFMAAVLGTAGALGFAASTAQAAPLYPRGKGPGAHGQESLTGKYEHYCAVKRDSTAWCWGSNLHGQLGNGSSVGYAIEAQQVVGFGGTGFLSQIVGISAGEMNTCVALSDGTAACWGRTVDNSVGNGSLADGFQVSPSLVMRSADTPLDKVKQVEVGAHYACALLSTGNVACWGHNGAGGMGDGTTATDASVHLVELEDGLQLNNIIQISASAYGATCALSAVGEVYCWGLNDQGQVGNPSAPATARFAYPVLSGAGNLGGIKSISVNGRTACALRYDGRILCWGSNQWGQYGTGSLTPAQGSSPTLASQLTQSANGIVVGTDHVCALLAQGTSHCWGYNLGGQLARGAAGNFALHPAANPYAAAFAHDTQWGMAAGLKNTCMQDTNGRVKCVGQDNLGQLGNGGSAGGGATTVPNFVGGANYYLGPIYLGGAVSSGKEHSCLLTAHGGAIHVECTGKNSSGQLGRNSVVNVNTLQNVHSGANMAPLGFGAQVATGDSHSCLLNHQGTVQCFGSNSRGQVRADGAANTSAALFAIAVPGLANGTTQVYPIQLTSGANHVCVLLSNGSVTCWGANDKGQIGNGTTQAGGGVAPTAVSLPAGAVWINAGANHTCALMQDGALRCWGENLSCSITGAGGTCSPFVSSPIQVPGFGSGILQVAPGAAHTCVLEATGLVSCMGSDAKGQLGFQDSFGGDDDTAVVYRAVTGLSLVTALDSGSDTVCARGNGSNLLHCWGENTAGQVGVSSAGAPVHLPQVVGSGLQVQAFSAGLHSLAALFSASFKSWGSGTFGQLGNAGNVNHVTPVTMLP